jgi:hypothetical protein
MSAIGWWQQKKEFIWRQENNPQRFREGKGTRHDSRSTRQQVRVEIIPFDLNVIVTNVYFCFTLTSVQLKWLFLKLPP